MAVIDYLLPDKKAENELQAVVQTNSKKDTTIGVLTIDLHNYIKRDTKRTNIWRVG